MQDDWDKNDELWQVLGQTPPAEPSPWLTSKVVREARQIHAKRRTRWWGRLRAPQLSWAVAGLLLVASAWWSSGWLGSDRPSAEVDPDLIAALEAFDASEGFEDDVLWIAALD